jgi:hypothetical protein
MNDPNMQIPSLILSEWKTILKDFPKKEQKKELTGKKILDEMVRIAICNKLIWTVI